MARVEAVITLIEKDTDDVMPIPWTPEKIKFKSGGQEYAEYDIMDYGTIQQAIGVGLRSVRIDDCILPSKNHQYTPWHHGGWMPPEDYQGMFSMWKSNHTVLTLIISNTPICMEVTLADYDVTYQDGMGDYHCYLEFSEAVTPTFTITGAEPDTSDTVERDYVPHPSIYTISDGDTLFGIAQCYLGDGLRWEEIYELNRDVLEDAAIQNGYVNSMNGDMIFPGTALRIPAVMLPTTAGAKVELNNAPVYMSYDEESTETRLTGNYYLFDGREVQGRYRITDRSANVERRPIGKYVVGWLPKEYI